MKILRNVGLCFMIIGAIISLVALSLGASGASAVKPFVFTDAESFSEEYTDITSLDFKFNAGVVTIKNGDAFRITVNNYPKSSIVSKIETDSLTGAKQWIIDEKKGFRLQVGIIDDETQSVTIELPKDFTARELNLRLGAGILEANNIQAEKSNISIGAGTLTIRNLVSKNSTIECGAGELIASGTLTGENTVKCGVGTVDLNLIGNPDDYFYSAKVGLGDIIINGDTWGGIANEFNQGSKNSTNSFNLECGMGDLNLNINAERSAHNESKKTL